MEQIIREIVMGLGLPTGLLVIIINYVVIPVSKKYIDFVDKAMANMDQLTISHKRCVEIQNEVLMELKYISAKRGNE